MLACAQRQRTLDSVAEDARGIEECIILKQQLERIKASGVGASGAAAGPGAASGAASSGDTSGAASCAKSSGAAGGRGDAAPPILTETLVLAEEEPEDPVTRAAMAHALGALGHTLGKSI